MVDLMGARLMGSLSLEDAREPLGEEGGRGMKSGVLEEC
jgi:hypothetical protein